MPGPAGDEDRVQAADIDAELERGGGGYSGQPAGAQLFLELAPVLRQVAGPVRRYPPGQVAGLGQRPPRAHRHRLGRAPGAHEGHRGHVLRHQVGQQPGRFGGGCPPQPRARRAAQRGERRLPQGERNRPARRRVGVDLLGREPGQQGGAPGRLGDGGRGQDEHRSRGQRPVPHAAPGALADSPALGVVGGDPAEPAQHLRHVRAEHPPVSVALVDDDVPQPGQETGPARVPGQQREVQRVRCGDQVRSVCPGPAAPGGRGVAVQGGRADSVQPQRPDRAQLVSGQGLGRREIKRGPALEHRGERGHQIAERLARGGRGGNDHVPAGPGVIGRGHLVSPRCADSAGGESLQELVRAPVRPRDRPARTARDALDVRDPSVDAPLAQDRAPGESAFAGTRTGPAAVSGRGCSAGCPAVRGVARVIEFQSAMPGKSCPAAQIRVSMTSESG